MKMRVSRDEVFSFVAESNRIEGINRDPTPDEVNIVRAFLNPTKINVGDLIMAVDVFEPGAKLRDKKGMDVRVGNHIAPPGGPTIKPNLTHIVHIAHGLESPHAVHCDYEHLHPFTDGNGRSGRLLWLWMMVKRDGVMPPLGFLHQWYYQSLESYR